MSRHATPRALPVGRMEPAAAAHRQRPRTAGPKPAPAPPGPDRWPAHAACRDVDPELFQPISESGPYLAQIEDAKAVCRRCPALAFCEAWAMSPAGPESGVLAAMSADERRSFKRREVRQRAQRRAG